MLKSIISFPSFHAYFVSQKEHLRLHPARRINIVGSPCRSPSPWSEKKISEIFRIGCWGILGFPDSNSDYRKILFKIVEKLAGKVFCRRIKIIDFVEKSMVRQYLWKFLLDLNEIDPYPCLLKFFNLNLGLYMECMPMNFFTFSLDYGIKFY